MSTTAKPDTGNASPRREFLDATLAQASDARTFLQLRSKILCDPRLALSSAKESILRGPWWFAVESMFIATFLVTVAHRYVTLFLTLPPSIYDHRVANIRHAMRIRDPIPSDVYWQYMKQIDAVQLAERVELFAEMISTPVAVIAVLVSAYLFKWLVARCARGNHLVEKAHVFHLYYVSALLFIPNTICVLAYYSLRFYFRFIDADYASRSVATIVCAIPYTIWIAFCYRKTARVAREVMDLPIVSGTKANGQPVLFEDKIANRLVLSMVLTLLFALGSGWMLTTAYVMIMR